MLVRVRVRVQVLDGGSDFMARRWVVGLGWLGLAGWLARCLAAWLRGCLVLACVGGAGLGRATPYVLYEEVNVIFLASFGTEVGRVQKVTSTYWTDST